MGGSNPNDHDPPTGDPPTCPQRLTAIFPNPGGLAQGEKLAVVFEPGPPGRAMLVTPTGVRLGPVAGVAQLGRFLECLREGVPYNAYVENLTDAAVTCTLLQAPG
jgi:hypothetical protein